MGLVMVEEVVGIINLCVVLFNIGEEEIKGLDNICEVVVVLKNILIINYIGYLEGNDLLIGKIDVMVCDGFVGNVILKIMEGVIRMFLLLFKLLGEGKK